MAARQACTGAPNLRGKARLGAWLHVRRALVPRTCGAGRRSGGRRTLDDMASVLRTHEVTNPPPLLVGYDVFGAEAALTEAVERAGAGWALDELQDLGSRDGAEDRKCVGEGKRVYCRDVLS